MSRQQTSSYDAVPYPSTPYAQSHPDRLATIARLFGMQPAPPERCRVLELGCADGSNLIPLALAAPQSGLLGVELSRVQVDSAERTIRQLGLANIEVRQCDILEVDDAWGEFDYIIAHGVFSWVPPQVQEKLLEICGRLLAPQGAAYVSYNTNPGWRMRGMLRDIMLYHTRAIDDPREQARQARAVVQFLAAATRNDDTPHAHLMRSELEEMRHWDDAYFLHDALEKVNEPIYFHQFVERAASYGLQFLGEAEFHTMLGGDAPFEVRETLRQLEADIVTTEQYLDFVRNRMFRQTLLCRREAQLDRKVSAERLTGLYAASPLRGELSSESIADRSKQQFTHPAGVALSAGTPLVKAALFLLAEQWPAALAINELPVLARRRLAERCGAEWSDAEFALQQQALVDALLVAFTRNMLELQAAASAFTTSVSTRPAACPLARYQATQSGTVTSRRMESVRLDAIHQRLLRLLDGRRDRAALASELVALAQSGEMVVREKGEIVSEASALRKLLAGQLEPCLEKLARAALLVG